MKIPIFNELFFKRSAIVFFIGLFVVGCFVFSDFGLSCDELGFNRVNGILNYNFIKTGDSKELLACSEKYHGPAFEILLYSAEKLFNIPDSRDFFLFRHALTFLAFFIATLFFYLLGLKIFKSHGIALLCSVMLVASPRIFAESFYNSKDLAMLSFCIIATYTAFIFIERQTIMWAIIHAALCGFVMDIRIVGMLLPIATLYLFLITKPRKITPIVIFILYTIFFTVAFWPILWINPVHHFLEAFKEMGHIQPISVLYFGQFVSGKDLPWHYLFGWISITTPICYIVFFLIGLFFLVKKTLVNFTSTLPIQFFLFMFATPILSVIILQSTVYDAYRHVFFVYPFLLLIAVYGLIQITNAIKNKWAVKIIYSSLIISIFFVFGIMIAIHPFQNVYFNSLAGKNIRQNFDLDYWGLSYRQGLEYILANDKSEKINIAFDNGECVLNFYIIPIEDRKRLTWTYDRNAADYYLTNFRLHPTDYNYGPSVFEIEVGNEKIMEVQKLTPTKN